MAIRARRKDTGDIVYASDCTIADVNREFLCATPGCKAKMSLVCAGDEHDAYFRTFQVSPEHVSKSCRICSMMFDASKYDESAFNRDSAFDWIFGQPANRRGNSGARTDHVGGGTGNGIRTLANMYKMCASRKKTDTYNGVVIGDILADDDNYEWYRKNLIGKKIVLCSFYRKVDHESALLFNYQMNINTDHIVVRLNFPTDDLCWRYYNLFKTSDHTEPIVIAGDWEPVDNGGMVKFQAEFHSPRQIHIVK